MPVAKERPGRRRQGVVVNFSSLAVSSIAGSVLALLATAHLARALGVVTFGSFNLARTLVEYALIPASFGITVTASRAIAKRPDGDPQLAGRVVALRILLSFVGAAGLAVVASFMTDQLTRTALAAMALAIPLTAANVDWLYSAHEDQRWPAVARTCGRAVYAILVVTLVATPADLRLAGVALVAEAALISLMMWVNARSWMDLSLSVITDLKGMWAHLKGAVHVGTAGLATRLKTNADLLILGAFGTAAAVGYYSAAYRLVLFVNALAGLYATVLLPRMSRASVAGDSRPVVRASFRATMLIGMAVSVGGAAIAGIAVVTLMGSAYAPAVGVTTALMVASGFIVVSLSLGYTAVALGHERAYGRITTGAAVANIAANLVLIPVFGMYAAAATTVVTEMALVIILALLLRREGLADAFTWTWSIRAVLLGVVLFASVRVSLVAGGGLWISAIVGVAVFVAGVIVLRLVSRQDWRVLSAGVSEA